MFCMYWLLLMWAFVVEALLFLHAANGETVRTVVAAFGVHAGIVEEQARSAHARRRVRRIAPGETAHAHTEQAAGIAGAVTRSLFFMVTNQLFGEEGMRVVKAEHGKVGGRIACAEVEVLGCGERNG